MGFRSDRLNHPWSRWAVAAACVAICCVLLSPRAGAAAQRVELLASAAQTATGNGAAIPVGNLKELAVYVDVTAVSGTTPLLDLWVQSSSDAGTTWYDLPFEMTLTDNPASATPGSSATYTRDILNGVSATGRAVAIYRTFGDYVRVRFVISGTTPSFTFSVKSVGK